MVFLDGSCNLHFSALEVVEIGVCSHDRLFVHVIDVQHALFCNGPVVICCLVLEIAEIGEHSHDQHFVQPLDAVICL